MHRSRELGIPRSASRRLEILALARSRDFRHTDKPHKQVRQQILENTNRSDIGCVPFCYLTDTRDRQICLCLLLRLQASKTPCIRETSRTKRGIHHAGTIEPCGFSSGLRYGVWRGQSSPHLSPQGGLSIRGVHLAQYHHEGGKRERMCPIYQHLSPTGQQGHLRVKDFLSRENNTFISRVNIPRRRSSNSTPWGRS